jgi:lipopolysaccharide biosynthesis glycosyltransferase
MTRPLPLLIATDENLLFAAATMLRSAQAALADGLEFDVYAYLDGVSAADTELFGSFIAEELGRAPQIVNDQSFSAEHQRLMDDLVEGLPRFPRALWARLFLPALVEDRGRAVFADIDVAVIRDVAPLWTMPLNGNAVGAVRDPAPDPAAQLAEHYPALKQYFNAGIMAIDVGAWVDAEVAERSVAWMLAAGRKSHFPDQDALNLMLMDDDGTPLWQEFDSAWNKIGGFGRPGVLSEAERNALVAEVRIRHFAGPFKPWNTERLMLKDVFDEHLAAVPFEVPLHLRTRRERPLIRRWVRRIRRALRRA